LIEGVIQRDITLSCFRQRLVQELSQEIMMRDSPLKKNAEKYSDGYVDFI